MLLVGPVLEQPMGTWERIRDTELKCGIVKSWQRAAGLCCLCPDFFIRFYSFFSISVVCNTVFVLYTGDQCWKGMEIDALDSLWSEALALLLPLRRDSGEQTAWLCFFVLLPLLTLGEKLHVLITVSNIITTVPNWNCISAQFFAGQWLRKLIEAGCDCTSSDLGVGGICLVQCCPEVWSNFMPWGSFP